MKGRTGYKVFFVTMAVITFVTMSATAILFDVRRSILNESTYMNVLSESPDTLTEHPYGYFITIMSKDFISRLSGILPESEIIQAYKNACPQSSFLVSVRPVVKNIVALLRGDANEITANLDIKEFKKGVTSFYHESSTKAVNPEHKKTLEHFSQVMAAFPDALLNNFIIPRSDVSQLEHVHAILATLFRWMIILGIIFIVSLAVLFFDLNVLGKTFLVSGALGLFSALLAVIAYFPRSPGSFMGAVVREATKKTFILLSIESAAILLLGAILVWTRRQKEGT